MLWWYNGDRYQAKYKRDIKAIPNYNSDQQIAWMSAPQPCEHYFNFFFHFQDYTREQ